MGSLPSTETKFDEGNERSIVAEHPPSPLATPSSLSLEGTALQARLSRKLNEWRAAPREDLDSISDSATREASTGWQRWVQPSFRQHKLFPLCQRRRATQMPFPHAKREGGPRRGAYARLQARARVPCECRIRADGEAAISLFGGVSRTRASLCTATPIAEHLSCPRSRPFFHRSLTHRGKRSPLESFKHNPPLIHT